MEIISVKRTKDGTTIIEFMESRQTQTVLSTLTDATQPTPEFLAKFAELKTLANEICDSKLSSVFSKYHVSQIWFKRDKAENLGCMLHVQVELETNNRPLHFNTPPKYTLGEGKKDSEFYLEGRSADFIREMQRLAMAFMNGERAQQEMQFGEEPSSKPRSGLKAAIDKTNDKPNPNSKLADKRKAKSLFAEEPA